MARFEILSRTSSNSWPPSSSPSSHQPRTSSSGPFPPRADTLHQTHLTNRRASSREKGGGGWMTPCSHTFHTLVSSLTSPMDDAQACKVVESCVERGDLQRTRDLVDARTRPLGRSMGETRLKTTRVWLGRWNERLWGSYGHPRHAQTMDLETKGVARQPQLLFRFVCPRARHFRSKKST